MCCITEELILAQTTDKLGDDWEGAGSLIIIVIIGNDLRFFLR
jgi:hypothetical protein